MSNGYRIQLNMLQIVGGIDCLPVFRKPAKPGESRLSENCSEYSLPTSVDPSSRSQYWCSVDHIEGFDRYECEPFSNIHLTIHILHNSLQRAAADHLTGEQFLPSKSGFERTLKLVMESHPEGQELLVVKPYFLKATQRFGFLVDFHFHKAQDVPFSRRVQQLSLSLDANFRRNLACYSERTAKIRGFLEKRKDFFTSLSVPNTERRLELGREYPSLPAKRLSSKLYIHGANRTSRSQFTGLRQNGPLEPLASPPVVLFCFRESDRHAARRLAMALRGQSQSEKLGFDGFESLFRTDVKVDGNPVVLPDLTQESFTKAMGRVQSERLAGQNTIPVFVLPEGDDNGYHIHKAIFANAGIPTQVCTLPVILDDYALKWSIANIALQLFCKAGGLPWVVQPTSQKTLIIGISQSHKCLEVDGRRTVEKYFAFSVLTDNSGRFQQIHVLGEARKEDDYYSQLKKNLSDTLSQANAEYQRVVIHTSFRLRRKEIDAIAETVREASSRRGAECDFAIVRVNHKSTFFGVNRAVNSLVPYEGTTAWLGGGQYLVWFEGIHPDKTTVNKAYPGPTFVDICRLSPGQSPEVEPILQDLVNLSGANWRGFNAKSAPVSVFYCHLVADLVHDFHAQNLPLPKITDLKPWFL